MKMFGKTYPNFANQLDSHTKNTVQNKEKPVLPSPSPIRIYYSKKQISENTAIFQLKLPSWSPDAKVLEEL